MRFFIKVSAYSKVNHMNTTVAVVIALVLLGGGGWYVYSTTQDDQEPEQSAIREEEQEERELSGTGTFESLLALGESVVCDIAYTDPEADTDAEGSVFVAGDDMRGDFMLTHDGEAFDSHMIKSDTMVYTWTESSRGTYAIKMTIDAEAEAGSDDMGSEQPIEWDQNVTYDCRAWERDESMFTPPADIEFMDPSSMMQDMMRQYGVPQ